MPDESCRKCGNSLYVNQKCQNCRCIIQEICMHCGQKTLPKYHICETVNKNTITV